MAIMGNHSPHMRVWSGSYFDILGDLLNLWMSWCGEMVRLDPLYICVHVVMYNELCRGRRVGGGEGGRLVDSYCRY